MLKQYFQKARTSGSKGFATMLTAITMLFLIPVVGLSIDGGFAFLIKARLSAAMDSAALAAGRGINLNDTIANAQAQATSQATAFFNANFPAGYLGTDPSNRTVAPAFSESVDANGNPTGVLTISMTGTVQSPTYFMKWLGYNSVPISATGTATRKNMVMMLVLDKSASMGSRVSTVGSIPATLPNGFTSCDAMVQSAAQFITKFSPYDTIGMISFDYTAKLEYAPSTNYWKSGAAGVTQAIANLNCGNNTNTTAALELGYNNITGVGQRLANNVLVLFTDGVPNAVNARFPVRTQADTRLGPAGAWATSSPSGPYPTPVSSPPSNNRTNCIDQSGQVSCNMPACTATAGFVTGVISQQAGFNVNSGNRDGLHKMFSTDSTPSSVSGCPTSVNEELVNQVIAYIPDQDFFGNATHGGAFCDWDNWLYQVNSHTAPNGTVITSGNSATKNMGGVWANYPGVSNQSSNFFTAGPYINKLRPDLVNTIGTVSMNTASEEANKIRNDTNYNITIDAIYLQGNGSDPVDRSFLQIVSNQQKIQPLIYDSGDAPYTNPHYDSTQQTGMWLGTTDAAQLTNLFNQLASSLLRISQ